MDSSCKFQILEDGLRISIPKQEYTTFGHQRVALNDLNLETILFVALVFLNVLHGSLSIPVIIGSFTIDMSIVFIVAIFICGIDKRINKKFRLFLHTFVIKDCTIERELVKAKVITLIEKSEIQTMICITQKSMDLSLEVDIICENPSGLLEDIMSKL